MAPAARWLPRPPDHELSVGCDAFLLFLARRHDLGCYALAYRIRRCAPARYGFVAAMIPIAV